MGKTLHFKVTEFQPLTDNQWSKIQNILEKPYTTGRPRKINLRNIFDGLRHLVRTGCQWRNIDKTYGTKSILRYYFDKWRLDNTWSDALQILVCERREQLGRHEKPSLGAVDSQSVKIVPLTKEVTGIDGNKKINGRKRHLIVDTQGLPLAIYVGAAHEHDGKEGVELLPFLQKNYMEVKNITADAAYKKTFEEAAGWCGIEVQIAQKPESQKGFVPQNNRWQVERTFAWLSFYRRLSKDYEKKPQNSVVMIQIAFISLILNHFL